MSNNENDITSSETQETLFKTKNGTHFHQTIDLQPEAEIYCQNQYELNLL